MWNKENLKRWAWSSLITFLGGAGMVLVANMENITLDSIKDGSVVGVFFLVARAGVKAVIEGILKAFYGVQK